VGNALKVAIQTKATEIHNMKEHTENDANKLNLIQLGERKFYTYGS